MRGSYRSDKLYVTWKNMRQRCLNPKRRDYKWYGGKGVMVCPEWDNFAAFEMWATNNGYADGLTIDRVNSSGNYEPSNCRWIPMPAQHANTSQTRLVTINGISKPLKTWCLMYGIDHRAVYQRVHRGMDNVAALLTPVKGGYKQCKIG